jgi:threonine synthase
VVPFAALKKAIGEGKIKEDEKIVVLVSGNGLKDINSAMKSVGQPLKIKPDLIELDKIVSRDFV